MKAEVRRSVLKRLVRSGPCPKARAYLAGRRNSLVLNTEDCDWCVIALAAKPADEEYRAARAAMQHKRGEVS